MVTNDKNKIIQNIKATIGVEGFELQPQDVSLIGDYLDNKITDEEGIDIIKKDIISRMNTQNNV